MNNTEPSKSPLAANTTVAHIETGRHLYGGAQQVVYLINGLAKRGVNNILIAAKDSAISQAFNNNPQLHKGIKVITTRHSGDLSWGFYREVKQILASENIDLVHIHSRRGADTLGGLAAKANKIPALLSRRVDNREHSLAIRFKYPLYRQVIGISQAICEVLLSQGVAAEKLHCVHSSVDTARFDSNIQARQRARASLAAQFNIPSDHLLLAVVAQLIPRKGHKHLLAVMPALLKQHPKTSLVIFGQGPEQQAIAAQIEALQLSDNVQLAGFCPKLDDDLAGIDLIVHPAEKEGLGVALLKASAAGIAMIAGRAGGIPEIVQDGKNGLLFEPGNQAQLSQHLNTVLSQPALREQMAQAGIQIAQNQFSIDTMVDGNLSVYHKILA